MATNDQVAHAWANQTGKHCRGSNFYYDGDTIYSYGGHFPIARHVDGVVLFTTDRYSNSTGTHIFKAARACEHLARFYVPDVNAHSSRRHKRNVQDYLKRIDEEYASALRATKYAEIGFRAADGLVDEVKRYAKRFKLGRTYVENHLITDEQREKALSRCDVRMEADRMRNEARAERHRASQAKQDEANRAHMERWARGEEDRKFHTTKVYLRASTDGSIVETSHGADVPYHSARTLYRYIRRKRETGFIGCSRYSINGEPVTVGDFKLSTLTQEGVVIGCHNISWEEVDRLAKVEGWSKD